MYTHTLGSCGGSPIGSLLRRLPRGGLLERSLDNNNDDNNNDDNNNDNNHNDNNKTKTNNTNTRSLRLRGGLPGSAWGVVRMHNPLCNIILCNVL